MRWRGGVPTRTSYKTYGARESSVVRVPLQYPQSTPEYPSSTQSTPEYPSSTQSTPRSTPSGGKCLPGLPHVRREEVVGREGRHRRPPARADLHVRVLTGVLEGYSMTPARIRARRPACACTHRGTRGVLEGYSRGTWEYSGVDLARGTRGVLEGYLGVLGSGPRARRLARARRRAGGRRGTPRRGSRRHRAVARSPA
jgi:hypothetical protein